MNFEKYLDALDKLPGAVSFKGDIYAEGVRSPSPSVNFIFGNTHLIPFGASAIFWGPPKGGKSLLCNFMIGQLHKDYPDAVAIKFNTELREKFQTTERSLKLFGIDPKRYKAFDTNRPEEIFDRIEKDIALLCEKGVKVRLIVIDSISDIIGRRTLNSDSVSDQQMADEAATVKDGLKRIRATLRRYGITLLLVAQERAVLDPIEVRRGKKTKMAGAFYLRHFAEYFVYVAPNEAKEGRVDIFNNKFENEEKDMMGNNEVVAHKIKVVMNDSSVGIAKRVGELTFHKYLGIINVYEEAFRLGMARGVFERPNNRTYILKNYPEEGKEVSWTSKEDCLLAIKDNEEVSKEIVNRCRLKDIDLFKNGAKDMAFIAATDDSDLPEFENEEIDE